MYCIVRIVFRERHVRTFGIAVLMSAYIIAPITFGIDLHHILPNPQPAVGTWILIVGWSVGLPLYVLGGFKK